MATPTQKNPEIEKFLSEITGDSRVDAIKEDRCIKAPVGCGGPAVWFKDEISATEYRISGLCQKCQDKVFGIGDDESSS